jgi:hypothetical protein
VYQPRKRVGKQSPGHRPGAKRCKMTRFLLAINERYTKRR